MAVPGLIKNGVVEEAPNLPQLKGARLRDLVASQLRSHEINAPVTVMNDADGDGGGAGFGAWEAGQHDSGVDAGRGDWVWALSVYARECGRAATRL